MSYLKVQINLWKGYTFSTKSGLFLNLYVCARTHKWLCTCVHVCLCRCVWRSDDTLECHSGAPSTSFETKPLIGLELTNEAGLVASKPEGSICCCPPQHPTMPSIFPGFWVWNSDSHVRQALERLGHLPGDIKMEFFSLLQGAFPAVPGCFDGSNHAGRGGRGEMRGWGGAFSSLSIC